MALLEKPKNISSRTARYFPGFDIRLCIVIDLPRACSYMKIEWDPLPSILSVKQLEAQPPKITFQTFLRTFMSPRVDDYAVISLTHPVFSATDQTILYPAASMTGKNHQG